MTKQTLNDDFYINDIISSPSTLARAPQISSPPWKIKFSENQPHYLAVAIDKPATTMSFPPAPSSPEKKTTSVQENKISMSVSKIPFPVDNSARTDGETEPHAPSPPPPVEIMCPKVSWRVLDVLIVYLAGGVFLFTMLCSGDFIARPSLISCLQHSAPRGCRCSAANDSIEKRFDLFLRLESSMAWECLC